MNASNLWFYSRNRAGHSVAYSDLRNHQLSTNIPLEGRRASEGWLDQYLPYYCQKQRMGSENHLSTVLPHCLAVPDMSTRLSAPDPTEGSPKGVFLDVIVEVE